MEIQGIVYRVLPVIKGTSARGEWMKQEVVLELQNEFNRKVCISFWGDKVQDVAKMREGTNVSVSVNIESREYNGRWFTEVRAWKISFPNENSPTPHADLPPLNVSDFEGGNSGSTEEIDDLPF
ncbi:MAG: DUF3127 domain-containing protein [Rikenellaceae bacterium]|nr:DUF3127 domain-containing protein [Rikenellaceae bacterium]